MPCPLGIPCTIPTGACISTIRHDPQGQTKALARLAGYQRLLCGLLAALLAIVTTGLYLLAMHGQGPEYPASPRVQLEAALDAALAISAAVGVIAPWRPLRVMFLGAAAAGFAFQGVVGIFSFGPLFLVAATLCMCAWDCSVQGRPSPAVLLLSAAGGLPAEVAGIGILLHTPLR